MNIKEWLLYGQEKGFCSPPYCETHDGISKQDGELWETLLEKYGDPDFCWTIVKVYAGDETEKN